MNTSQATQQRDRMVAELAQATTSEALRAIYLDWLGLSVVDAVGETTGDMTPGDERSTLQDFIREFCHDAGVQCPTFQAPARTLRRTGTSASNAETGRAASLLADDASGIWVVRLTKEFGRVRLFDVRTPSLVEAQGTIAAFVRGDIS